METEKQHLAVDGNEAPRLRVALILRSATRHAHQAAASCRKLRLEKDDLRQDIVVDILSRIRAFDPGRSPFGAFVDLLARHAALRLRHRAIRSARCLPMVSMTGMHNEELGATDADGTPMPPQPAPSLCTWSTDQRLALWFLAVRYPDRLFSLIQAQGAPSRTTAWRRQRQLRLLLLAAGIEPAP